MSDVKDKIAEENIADPFADSGEPDLDLSGLTSDTPVQESSKPSLSGEGLSKELEKIAVEERFTERKVIKAKPKTYAKTASLFEDELEIVDSARSDYKKHIGIVPKPSDSDVIRAALRAYERLPLEQRIQLLHDNIARKGRVNS